MLDLRRLRWLHVLCDSLLVSIGWLGAWGVRRALGAALDAPINPFEWYVAALPVVVGPWIATCWWFGIYHGPRMKTAVDELAKLLRGAALGLLVLSAIAFFFKEFRFGRTVVLASAGINLALQLLQKLQDHPEIGYRVVGYLDDVEEVPEKEVAGRPVLGRLEDLREVAVANDVREIFVAMPSLGHTRMLSLVLAGEDLGITFRVVTNLFEVLTAGTQIDLVDDLPLVRLGRESVHGLYDPAKRVFDVVTAAAALLAVAPLMLWVTLRLRGSGVSPLFVQERVGKEGRRFRMLKFRTLREDAEPYAVAPHERDDPRVTPYGRWLRRTSIDELPQLWNVLRGEMSMVGPRPEMPFIADTYDEWQRRRLTVKPGITGLWQILGRKDLPMHENLHYDFYYIRNRSIAHDTSILLRTVWAVLSRRGAF
jgi:exopolysaccharide biosynthesis polyprenyl glycosylphosphotransferase